jgi:hypothetical protein
MLEGVLTLENLVLVIIFMFSQRKVGKHEVHV